MNLKEWYMFIISCVWAHAKNHCLSKSLIYIAKLQMQPTSSNMFQNDNVTNDLIYGLLNDHRFEDTAISRITKYILLF